MKDRKDLLRETYLNQAEVRRLFKLTQRTAKKAFDIAMQIDREQLGDRLLCDNKVRIKTAMKVVGIDYSLLSKQVNEE